MEYLKSWRWTKYCPALLVVAALFVYCPDACYAKNINSCIHSRQKVWQQPLVTDSSYLSQSLMVIRGGASKGKAAASAKGGKSRTASLFSLDNKKKKDSKAKTATGGTKVGLQDPQSKPSALSDTMQKYKSILPTTRVYITLVVVTTLLGLVLGDELTQTLLALDPIRVFYGFEFWRPITAACFLGPPSIGWLMSAYFLFEYGSSLERAYGTAQHIVFLLGQVVLLSLASVIFGQPFFGPSVITAMLHVLSRSMPHQKVKWLVFTVPYWSLPYGLMLSDVLQTQSATAALPHVLGILSGHVYYFHKFIWPRMGGEDWLVAPSFIAKKLDPNYYDPNENKGKKRSDQALKHRKKGKGHKLGS